MNAATLQVTITATPRPWYRPVGIKALRRWYLEARRNHGRAFSVLAAVCIARKEFRFGS